MGMKTFVTILTALFIICVLGVGLYTNRYKTNPNTSFGSVVMV